MTKAWNIYLREGIVFVPTTANAGYFLDIEPVTVVSANDRHGVIAAIKSTIAKGNPKHRQYSRGNFPPPVVLKPAGVKTWKAFESKAYSWIITLRDGAFVICPQMKIPEGGWVDNPEKVKKIPLGTSIDEVAEKVAEQIVNEATLAGTV